MVKHFCLDKAVNNVRITADATAAVAFAIKLMCIELYWNESGLSKVDVPNER